MEQPIEPNDHDLSSAQPQSSIGRRELLKALATGGLAMAATALPIQWTAPHTKVNYLPIHAQVSGPQAQISGVCDSLPGGGDLRITQGAISNIQPYLRLLSGIASLQSITTTMDVEVTSGSLPTFSPNLPQGTTTNATGQAIFSNLQVTGQPGDHFFLVFNFAAPTGNIQLRCGEFYFGTTDLTK